MPKLGRQKLSPLRPEAIQTLYAHKLAPRTIDKIHVVVHRALKVAVRWGQVPRNPADTDAVDKPKPPRHEFRPGTRRAGAGLP